MTIVAQVTTWLRETIRHYRLLCPGPGWRISCSYHAVDQDPRSEAGLLSPDEY